MAVMSDAPLSHPEKMHADFDLSISKHISFKGTARITLAGLICAGIAGVTILIAAPTLLRTAG